MTVPADNPLVSINRAVALVGWFAHATPTEAIAPKSTTKLSAMSLFFPVFMVLLFFAVGNPAAAVADWSAAERQIERIQTASQDAAALWSRRPSEYSGHNGAMRCPWCTALDDKVVDSRSSEEGSTTRRRRECLNCGRRFTTYERVEELPLVVIKRSGERQPFDRAKLIRGLEAAAKNRPVDQAGIDAIASDIEEAARMDGPEVTSEWIGRTVLDRLRAIDEVAYLRFASVHKGFKDAEDFEREMGELR